MTNEELQAENQTLRRMLFNNHSCEAKYGDDGEMQCNQPGCMIDFLRAPADEIEGKLFFRGLAWANALARTRELQHDDTNPNHREAAD